MTISTVAFFLAFLSAYNLDQNLALYFKQPELGELWLKARAVTNVGLSEYYFVTAILLYIFARWLRPGFIRLREWSRNLFFSLLVSGIFIHILKFCVGRQRPHKTADFNPFIFNSFTTHWDFHSFGSGHTQVLFTVATMLSMAQPKAKWLFYTIAAFFAFTRVIIHDHFLSDVIGGAVVGYIGTLTAVHWTNRWQSRRANVPTNP